MKSAVIIFPGTNREQDIRVALRQASGIDPLMIFHLETSLPDVDLIVLPGGFAHGDYLRCGAMAARSPIVQDVVAKAKRGVPVLGVCNGFQVLTETGLLPGALMRNADLKFVCRNVDLRVETSQSIFTSGLAEGEVMNVPVAHHDGNYFADEATLDRLESEGRVAFRYCAPDGAVDGTGNPNGSTRNIAGIFNETKTVLGMMPHPEDAVDPLHGGIGGRGLFDGIVRALS
ncbi:MAG: phosphoribosylformylglycinamidine synthase subunit PurQ [Alphaproteobacteria bacterium]|nr:phosphoribosylformylglycinamidine synthase subunit PurQ [Alphaproteobacteria bacterium]MBU0796691.1 phosphoribosylformylglycinamidine synthase subunit PurQ [Alphaproteobacteria bacterium]MBU0888240.1 phosphoribosylformylglycinamidine synthase subunit PurQ [Alphaproteobacteria bacterium]MBU1811441.1 phosphoribosylformylglycinamidine synthase subunit PurQ [Alphaproteobacteria bacterium]